jgi:hypothetical protein
LGPVHEDFLSDRGGTVFQHAISDTLPEDLLAEPAEDSEGHTAPGEPQASTGRPYRLWASRKLAKPLGYFLAMKLG